MEFYAPFKNAEVDPQNCTETSVLLLRHGAPKAAAAPDATPKTVRSRFEAERRELLLPEGTWRSKHTVEVNFEVD